MKKIATMTAIALLAGVSFASAQNATGPAGPGASPSNLNSVPNDDGRTQSGTESRGAAAVKGSSTVAPSTASTPGGSPAAANATPQEGGGTSMSGSQPQRTVSQPGGAATTGTATTGPSAISPADQNAKPPASK